MLLIIPLLITLLNKRFMLNKLNKLETLLLSLNPTLLTLTATVMGTAHQRLRPA